MLGDVEIQVHTDLQTSLHALETEFPGLTQALVEDFTRYAKSEGESCPNYFGRDSIYNHPYVAERAKLRHIHICLPPATFDPQLAQVDRTNRRDNPERDGALVYVQHELFEHRFLLLALLMPDAHGQARHERLMRNLGYKAQAFQDS